MGRSAGSGGAVRFVILATPRTGSNWLCTLLDSHPDVLCHHEIFNPEGVFHARSCQPEQLGLATVAERDRDPEAVLRRIWRRPLGHRAVGFKHNRGQSAAVLARVLEDAAVRKIILRRDNRIRTFVSEELARRTGEWESYPGREIGSGTRRLEVTAGPLRRHARENARHYADILQALESTGQRALELRYERLAAAEERARALRFLGVEHPQTPLHGATRKQHPEPLRALIANFEELAVELRGSDLEPELYAPDP